MFRQGYYEALSTDKNTTTTTTISTLMAVLVAVIASLLTGCLVLAGVHALVSLTTEPQNTTAVIRGQQGHKLPSIGVLLGDEQDCNSINPQVLVHQVQERRLAENVSDVVQMQLVFPTNPVGASCGSPAEVLRALLEAMMAPEQSALIVTLPSVLCDTAIRLAALKSKRIVTWSCPQVMGSRDFAVLEPSLASRTAALTQLHKSFRWKQAAIIVAESPEWWRPLAHQLDVALRRTGVAVRHHWLLQGLPDSPPYSGLSSPPQALLRALQSAHCNAVILCMPSDSQLFARLVKALDRAGMETLGSPVLLAFAADFMLSPRSPLMAPPPALTSSTLSATTLDSLLFLAALDEAPTVRLATMEQPPQKHNVSRLAGMLYEGMTLLQMPSQDNILFRGSEGQPVRVADGYRRTDFVLLQRRDSKTWEPAVSLHPDAPRPRHVTVLHEALVWAPSWNPLPQDNECERDGDCHEEWTDNSLELIHVMLAIIGALLLVGISIAAFVIIRRQLQKKRMSKGPNKIILTPSDFVFPQIGDNRRVDAGIEAMLCCWLQHLQEFGAPDISADRPDLLQGSVPSLRAAAPAGLPSPASAPACGSQASLRIAPLPDRRARYNGDLVQLKELPNAGGFELKSKALDVLVTLHGLRHENLAPLVGCLAEPSRPCLVTEWSSRGSLQDVLVQDEIKLDWSFRLSLLTDLVRGMRYIHSSAIRVHGYLTSRNCVIDSRWVLKITDYGLPMFYDAQGIHPPLKTARELLWTAPELLRDPQLRRKGTQPGDVYSFGIIMQEVVLRGEPFCTLALTPEEILEKIRRPPPLIRPSVSKGAAPPEAINVMRQCWAENPDMRPNVLAVHDLFKQLNHGRKANIVDTMFQMLEKYSNNLEELIRERTEQLDMEKRKTEQLLNRMLPSSVAEKLKLGMPVGPEEFREVTIYFSDIVGFTTISAHSSPLQVVDLLNELYTSFDATINAYCVYKVETIGDAYMVVSGLPLRIADHAEQIATMALDLLHQSGRFRIRHLPGTPLRLRIGMHSGSCCAGVVGLTMPRYCLFGDTVNTASRMESTGAAWRVHVSQATRDLLEKAGGYDLEFRGDTEVKGKGRMPTYWLLGKAGFNKPLPTPPPLELDERFILSALAECTDSADISVDVLGDSSRSHSPRRQLTTESTSSMLHSSAPNLSPTLAHQSSESSATGRARLTQTGSAPADKRWYPEEDLSRAYNHYRCLQAPADISGSGLVERRTLRRQYSLDKDDEPPSISGHHTLTYQLQQVGQAQSRRSLFKQNSAGASGNALASSPPRDLSRIDELSQERRGSRVSSCLDLGSLDSSRL